MQFNKIFILILLSLSFLIGCSKSPELADEETGGTTGNFTTIENIEGKIIKINATTDIQSIELGPIYNSSNELIKTSDVFELIVQQTGVKIAPSNASNPSSFLDIIEISPEADGKIKFKSILPTVIGLYSISIKAKTYKSAVGLIYVQVGADSITQIGSLSAAFFQDLAPYNGIRESNEKYSVLNSTETLVTIGPIRDKFNNLATTGKITVFLINGYFGGSYRNSTGDYTSLLEDVSISNGYVSLPVVPIDPNQTVRVVSSLSALLTSQEDYSTIPPALLLDDSLAVLDSVVQVLGIETKRLFDVVFIGQSKTQTMDIRNLGNAVVNNLSIGVDAPFEITGGTCVDKPSLQPQEQCTLSIKFSASVRSFGNGDLIINGSFNGKNIEEVREPLFAQAAFPVNLNLIIENNLIEFAPQPVGELITKAFSVVNTGDVPARNVRFQSPPPYPGQNETFYTFSSLSDAVPNDDDSFGEHCGNEFPPQKKCKIYVNFYPTAKVGTNILNGSLIVDGLDPLSIFVKGPSYVNNFERIIGISSIKNTIRKDEIDSADIIVGPIRDIFGAVVSNQNIEIQIFRYTDPDKTIQEHLGSVSSPSLIIGGPPNTYLLRTDSNGYANFNLKSRIKDTVGDFIIEAKIVDTDLNVLSSGETQFKFLGAKLLFEQDLYNFANVVINNEVTKSVVLKNDGSLDAQNIQVFFDEEYFEIKDEGTCLGVTEGTLSLLMNTSCSFTLSFTAPSKNSYFDNMRIQSSTVGNKISSDVYGVGINPAKLASSVPIFVGTHVVGSNEPLSGSIVFNNIGDESAVGLSAFTELENESFSFDITCTKIESGRSCVINFDYNPNQIPSTILNTGLVIQGVGEIAGNGTQVRIPIEILHSSMRFKQTDPGINIGKCYELQVEAFDTEDSLFDFSQNLVLGLDNGGENGQFYSDLNCGAPITTITMPANSYLTPKFYYKAMSPGVHIIKTISSELASAMKSFVIYKEPKRVEIVSGNFQKLFTERPLPQKIILKVVDEDGNGVPNIPVSFTQLDDIRNQTQLITNSNFSSSIAGWTPSDTTLVSWFRGFSGSIRLASTTAIASATSSVIPVVPNSNYIYAVQVSEVIGSPSTSNIKVTILNGSAVIDQKVISGVKVGVFRIKIPAGVESVRMKLETTGFSRTTASFIESVFFVNDLPDAPINTIKFGTVSSTIPSTFLGPGEIDVNFETGKVPLISIIKANSTNSTITGSDVIISSNVEFPTNIQGLFGDLVISSTGPSLIKNGGNNLPELQGISGYSWNSTTKTLSLPANRIYDFRNITVDATTTLEFKAPNDKKLEWTSLYAKESCLINGTIRLKGFQTDGNLSTKNLVGLDNELISSNIFDYNIGSSGGVGGSAGYRNLIRTRNCTQSCSKSCSTSCGAWSAYNWSGGYVQQRLGSTGLDGNKFSGGNGGNGSGLSWGSGSGARTMSAVTGGLGGSKGLDGGLLFLHCFLGVGGNGKVDLEGEPGIKGNNGANGTYLDYINTCTATKFSQCTQQTLPRYMNGGGGAGAGGDGGNGGSLVMKSKSLNHDVSVLVTGGTAGAGGAGGVSFHGLNDGANGSIGKPGKAGTCKKVNPQTNQQEDC